jgi:hypothetical protein
VETQSGAVGTSRKYLLIAAGALAGITAHLVLCLFPQAAEPLLFWPMRDLPLLLVLALGGLPLVVDLMVKLSHR